MFVAVLIIFSGAALWQAYSIAGFDKWSSPGVFPMLASGTMMICALHIFRDTWRKKKIHPPHDQREHGLETASTQQALHSAAVASEQDAALRSSQRQMKGSLPIDSDRIFPTRVVFITIALVLYIVAMPALGFLFVSFLFLFASISYLWNKSLWMSMLVSVLSLSIIHIVFRQVFQVVLPYGTLLELFR